jgi:hypothetical protein
VQALRLGFSGLLAAALLAIGCGAASATAVTYDLTATLNDGVVVTGSFTINLAGIPIIGNYSFDVSLPAPNEILPNTNFMTNSDSTPGLSLGGSGLPTFFQFETKSSTFDTFFGFTPVFQGSGTNAIITGLTNFGEAAITQFPNGSTPGLDLFFTSASITQTPLPPAIWLFGTALFGLLGLSFSRRSKLPVRRATA